MGFGKEDPTENGGQWATWKVGPQALKCRPAVGQELSFFVTAVSPALALRRTRHERCVIH